MILYVTQVVHIGGFRLEVTFSDGSVREVDLKDEMYGPVFEPLQNESAFAEVFLDPETRTVTWPNGAGFAPEFMHTLGKEVTAA